MSDILTPQQQVEALLAQRFPCLDRARAAAQSDYHRYGLEIGPGWVPLLITFAEAVEQAGLADHIRVRCVKEKFGGLRIYFDGHRDAVEWKQVDDAYNAVAADAVKTCELCGAPGERRQRGWVKASCDTHREQRWSPLLDAHWQRRLTALQGQLVQH